jgi:hypothetical protein
LIKYVHQDAEPQNKNLSATYLSSNLAQYFLYCGIVEATRIHVVRSQTNKIYMKLEPHSHLGHAKADMKTIQ